MQLFEAIIDANQRAARGEKAGLRPSEFADALPIVALTCIDPRLNPLMPEVLGIPEEHFIWLRNAGNIITGPVSSTLRSLALACAIKGGKEIAVIGHTDCRVKQTSVSQLLDRFRALGIDRAKLPDNMQEFFGLFASERQNVIKAVDFVRNSPLIGAAIPVHGLLVDIQTGQLEWLVNGYQSFAASAASGMTAPRGLDLLAFDMGSMKFPDMKIGEVGGAPAPVAPKPTLAPSSPPAPLPKMRVRTPEPIPVPPRIFRDPPRNR